MSKELNNEGAGSWDSVVSGWEKIMSEMTRGERLQIMLSPQELQALDTWRFKAHMPSRAAAIRELLRRGLHAEGFELAVTGAKSSDFGILGNNSDAG